jgi:hypothetical protein|tara:strand:+ start:572 stop:835 length:264 start_codon:yes stop_codon:yes gene_type:complete
LAIPKKYKKQIKGAMKTARASGIVEKASKRRWTVCEVGDLVRVGEEISTVIEKRSDGWFHLLGPSGKNWVRGTKIERIQSYQAPVQT